MSGSEIQLMLRWWELEYQRRGCPLEQATLLAIGKVEAVHRRERESMPPLPRRDGAKIGAAA
jgi:hypothetical protein